MANTIKIKRSGVPGKVPSTSDLQIGELGVNFFDGRLFLKKNNGSESIVQVGAGQGDLAVAGSASDVLSIADGVLQGADAEATKIVYWDDTQGKLSYLAIGSGLSISSGSMSASGGGGGGTGAFADFGLITENVLSTEYDLGGLS